MKKIHLLISAILFASFCYGQIDSVKYKQKFETLKKTSLIFLSYTEMHKTTGGKLNSRSMNFDFRLGSEGRLQNIGKNGQNLKPILMKDAAAYNEFNKAYTVHRKKKRICSATLVPCYAALAVSGIFTLIGASKYEEEGITPTLIYGGSGLVLTVFTGVILERRINKHMDNFANSIKESVFVFNDNVIKNSK